MKKISIFLFSLLFVALIGCSEDDFVCDCIKPVAGGDTIINPIDTTTNPVDTVINPIDTTTYPVDTTATEVDTILVSPLLDSLKDQGMPIYTGTTPPELSESYLVSKAILIMSNIPEDRIGNIFDDGILTFTNYQANKLLVTQTLTQGEVVLYGEAAQVSGSGNNFTVAHTMVGYNSKGVYTKMAVVCSATKTPEGLTNLWYAFWMREKGSDPEHTCINVGDYRVITDQDGLAVKYYGSGKVATKGKKAKSGLNLFSIIR